jgi:2-aminoadipate transaminase
MSIQVPFALAERARRAGDQPISYLMSKALATPGLISLAAGFVDYQTLPTAALAEQAEAILRDANAGQTALQYGTTEGLAALRQGAFEHMAALDQLSPEQMPGSAEDVVITTGSQQMLHLLTDVLIDPGDVVIAAWPSYFVYTGALDSFGAVVRAVDTDEHGLIPEKLDRLLAGLSKANQLHRVKLIYTCSYHQNPTGLTLPTERRTALLEILQRYATEHRILLIEDAAYRELTYGPPGGDPASRQGQSDDPAGSGGDTDFGPPSIKSFDTENAYVALLQTFSKPFAPGLKLGYGLLPSDLVEPVKRAKGGRDFGSANLSQHLMQRALETGRFREHLTALRAAYQQKRDAMLAALKRELGDREDVTWTLPTGGLYIWLTLPEALDTGGDGPLFERALEEGVLYVPGSYCYPPDPTRDAPVNSIRLSFGVPTVEQIDEGIARLARAVRSAVAAQDAASV